MGIITRVAHNIDGPEPCHKTRHLGGWFTRRKCCTQEPTKNANINGKTGTLWWRDVVLTRREIPCISMLLGRNRELLETDVVSKKCGEKYRSMARRHQKQHSRTNAFKRHHKNATMYINRYFVLCSHQDDVLPVWRHRYPCTGTWSRKQYADWTRKAVGWFCGREKLRLAWMHEGSIPYYASPRQTPRWYGWLSPANSPGARPNAGTCAHLASSTLHCTNASAPCRGILH